MNDLITNIDRLHTTPMGEERIRRNLDLQEADEWRVQAWEMIRQRQDLEFLILTKRIDRFEVSFPSDWGDGYENVNLGCTVENQEIADYRLPLFLSYPIKRRFIACSPLLGAIDLSPYLKGVEYVTVAGESGRDARECDYNRVLDIRENALRQARPFGLRERGRSFGKTARCRRLIRLSRASMHDIAGLI